MWHNSHSYASQERQSSGGKHWGQPSSVVKAWSSSQPLNRAQVSSAFICILFVSQHNMGVVFGNCLHQLPDAYVQPISE